MKRHLTGTRNSLGRVSFRVRGRGRSAAAEVDFPNGGNYIRWIPGAPEQSSGSPERQDDVPEVAPVAGVEGHRRGVFIKGQRPDLVVVLAAASLRLDLRGDQRSFMEKVLFQREKDI